MRIGAFLLVVLVFAVVPALAAGPTTEMVSVSSTGTQGEFDSGGSGLSAATRSEVSISGDGRFVAFESDAGTLAPGDTNNRGDIFVHDRVNGATVLASVGTNGEQETGHASRGAVLSRDGRFLAFMSYADLESADTNDAADIYVRDLATGTTARVSVGTEGQQGDNGSVSPAMSPDGRFVAFSSIATTLAPMDPDNLEDIYLRDRDADVDGVMDEPGAVKTTLVSVGGNGKKEMTTNQFPTVSADGRFVAFHTLADEWVPGDANRADDVYLRDTVAGTTTRVSVGMGGADANHESTEPSISDDGRFIAFSSQATNLVPGDTNEVRDVFVFDRAKDVTTRLSVSSAGAQAEGGRSLSPFISPDGKVVVFESEADGLAESSVHSDIYIRHRDADADGVLDEPGQSSTSLVNLSRENGPADASSWSPVISADRRWVAFASYASNYVARDTNNKFDVFVRGPIPEPFLAEEDGSGAGVRLSPPPAVRSRKLRSGVRIGFTTDVAGTLSLRALVPAGPARRLGLTRTRRPVLVARGSQSVATPGAAAVRLAPTVAGRTLSRKGFNPDLKLRGTFTSAAGARSAVAGTLSLKR